MTRLSSTVLCTVTHTHPHFCTLCLQPPSCSPLALPNHTGALPLSLASMLGHLSSSIFIYLHLSSSIFGSLADEQCDVGGCERSQIQQSQGAAPASASRVTGAHRYRSRRLLSPQHPSLTSSVAVCCSVLQCDAHASLTSSVAVCCSVLQCDAHPSLTSSPLVLPISHGVSVTCSTPVVCDMHRWLLCDMRGAPQGAPVV